MNDFQKIESVEKQISQYHEMKFDNDNEDYNYNKTLKNKLKEVIINSKTNSVVIQKALLVLAKSTGCTQDHEIAEDIINYLLENKIINNNQLDLFYDNLGTNRWL